jgi:hypothetical protein
MLRILSAQASPSTSQQFNDQKQRIFLIIQFCSGCLSVIGSSLILFLIWKSPISSHAKRREGRLQRGSGSKLTFERIMIGLSVSDLFHSLRCMTMDVPVPTGVPGTQFASGNQASCSAQGFFAQLAITILYYSTSLSVYFVLCINPNIDDKTIKQRYEPFLHAIPILFSIIPAFVGLFFGMYNPLPPGQECWLAPYPVGCDNDDNNTDCTRGKNATILILYFAGTAWLCFLIIVCCMIAIYVISWRQQRKMESNYPSTFPEPIPSRASVFHRNSSVESLQSNNPKLRRIANQACLYIAVVFITWIWTFIIVIILKEGSSGKTLFGITIMEKIFLPLQGLLNFMIYIRPYFVDYWRKNTRNTWLQAMQYIFTGNTSSGFLDNVEPNQNGLRSTHQSNKSAGYQQDEIEISNRESSTDDQPSSSTDNTGLVELLVTENEKTHIAGQ